MSVLGLVAAVTLAREPADFEWPRLARSSHHCFEVVAAPGAAAALACTVPAQRACSAPANSYDRDLKWPDTPACRVFRRAASSDDSDKLDAAVAKARPKALYQGRFYRDGKRLWSIDLGDLPTAWLSPKGLVVLHNPHSALTQGLLRVVSEGRVVREIGASDVLTPAARQAITYPLVLSLSGVNDEQLEFIATVEVRGVIRTLQFRARLPDGPVERVGWMREKDGQLYGGIVDRVYDDDPFVQPARDGGR